MQLLEELVKHTSILVTYKYDSGLCEASYKRFLTQGNSLILVSVFLFVLLLEAATGGVLQNRCS